MIKECSSSQGSHLFARPAGHTPLPVCVVDVALARAAALQQDWRHGLLEPGMIEAARPGKYPFARAGEGWLLLWRSRSRRRFGMRSAVATHLRQCPLHQFDGLLMGKLWMLVVVAVHAYSWMLWTASEMIRLHL
jgi:hypothetical protein